MKLKLSNLFLEFEVGTAMGLGNINHNMTGSKQKHTDTKSLKQYKIAR